MLLKTPKNRLKTCSFCVINCNYLDDRFGKMLFYQVVVCQIYLFFRKNLQKNKNLSIEKWLIFVYYVLWYND